jgi:hypothetical protein
MKGGSLAHDLQICSHLIFVFLDAVYSQLRSFNLLQFFGFLAQFRKNQLHACKVQMGKIRYRPTEGVVTLYACFFSPCLKESTLQKIRVKGAIHSKLN